MPSVYTSSWLASATRQRFMGQFLTLSPPLAEGLCLEVGEIEMVPQESMLAAALTLASIFPRMERMEYVDEDWRRSRTRYHSLENLSIARERNALSLSSKNFNDISLGATLEDHGG